MASLAWRTLIWMGVLTSLAAQTGARADSATHAAALREIDDLKSVFATVRSHDRIEARVRTPGTIATLKVERGDAVTAGQVLAVVADPKIALKIKALDAQILAARSRVDTAKADLDRAEALKAKGVTAQARVDQSQTTFDVASNDLKAAQAELSVVKTQISEGEVLAPAAGRVLQVPVTEGSVVLAGESIATIAANGFLLRLELPERHARFIKLGDVVSVGARGLSDPKAAVASGRIVKVYPELTDGRVIADAEVPQLGDYFVGERVQVWISAGKRKAIVVPASAVFKRFGLDYVRVDTAKGVAEDVVVQTGRVVADAREPGIEILSGLADGDKVLLP